MPGPDEIMEMLEAQGDVNQLIVEDNGGGEQPQPKPVVQEEPAPQPQPNKPADAFDFSKAFEGFTDIEEVKTLAKRGRDYSSEVENELVTLRQSKQEIETTRKEVEELKARNPFKNEKLYKLDKLGETDPDNVHIYQKYLFGDLSDMDVIKLDMIKEFPDLFKENPSALERKLAKKYPALFDDDFAKDSNEYADDQIEMKIDAKKVRQKFDGIIGEVKIPAPKAQSEEAEKANKAFVDSWTPEVPKIREALTKLSLKTLDKDNNPVDFMSIDIPKEDVEEINKTALHHIINNRIKPSAEAVELAKEIGLGVYLIKNQAKIFTTFADTITKETGVAWRTKVANSKKHGDQGPGAGAGGDQGSETDNIFSQINADMK
jgi:hypothetical protein